MTRSVKNPYGPPAEDNMGLYARTLIAVEMKKRRLTFRDLTDKLNQTYELDENERNVRNKVARGTFSAAFFLMCMVAMDCLTITIEEGHKKGGAVGDIGMPMS